MRKSGHYWVKTNKDRKRKDVVFYSEVSDKFYIPGYADGLLANEFYWISNDPIEEPKQELIPGKYYIVQFKNNVVFSTKRIAKLHSNGNFVFLGCHNSTQVDNYDILSEPFDIDDLMEHWGIQ